MIGFNSDLKLIFFHIKNPKRKIRNLKLDSNKI